MGVRLREAAQRARREGRAGGHAGSVWTFSAIDAESRLVVSYLAGDRDGESALALVDDLRKRLDDRPRLATDRLKAYIEGVQGAFGGGADYAQAIEE